MQTSRTVDRIIAIIFHLFGVLFGAPVLIGFGRFILGVILNGWPDNSPKSFLANVQYNLPSGSDLFLILLCLVISISCIYAGRKIWNKKDLQNPNIEVR